MAIYSNDRDPNEIMWENQTKTPIAKQTAVDFLVELLPQIDWDDPYYRGILQEAKDMEKEQMIKFAFDFYYDYSTKVNVPINLITDNRINAEQYYNETYGKK